MTGVWVLDVRLDTGTRTIGLYAYDRSTSLTHVAALELLTVASVRVGLGLLIERFGRPLSILTDHGALFEGLGEAVGVEHLRPTQPTNPAWIERMLRRGAA